MNRIFPTFVFAILTVSAPLMAATGSALLEERFQAALNQMVQHVRQAPEAEAKREILQHFLGGMSQGLEKAESMESIPAADRSSLQAMQVKFRAYDAELNGEAGYARVPDADLNRFASYVQQGMEQAPLNGGIYISAGALIVILILLIILV